MCNLTNSNTNYTSTTRLMKNRNKQYLSSSDIDEVIHRTLPDYDEDAADDASADEKASIVSSSTQKSPRPSNASPRLSQRRCKFPASKKEQRHLITRHDYHDHSADPVEFMSTANNTTASNISNISVSNSANSTAGSCNNLTTPFPIKLYEMIEQMEQQGMSHIISWQPHGRCFLVRDVATFKQVLPNYFKLSKMASFQRQLNLYGFQRLKVGLDKGSYYHELFLRNRLDLISRIQRVKVKGTGVRAKSNPSDEPNLYLYPAVDVLASVAVLVPSDVLQVSRDTKETPSMSFHHQTAGIFPVYSTESLEPNPISAMNCVYDTTYLVKDRGTDTGFDVDPVTYTEVSYDNSEAQPWTTVNGLVRNLSSLNILSSALNSYNNYPSKPYNTISDMQNASFSRTNILRNISSFALGDTRPKSIIAPYCSNSTSDVELVDNNDSILLSNGAGESFQIFEQNNTIIDDTKKATAALAKIQTTNKNEDDISFDKLIDEMFHHDQNLDFSDLVKLATEV